MLKTKILATVLASCFLVFFASNSLKAQITFEANAGIGVTGVDIDAWTYGSVYDWGLLMGIASAAIHPIRIKNVSVGAEFIFHHFFWYNVKYRYSSYYLTSSDYNIDAFGFMAVVRVNITKNLFTDVGVGPYIFSEYTDTGAMASAGYKINLGEHLYIPLKIRAEIVFDEDANLYPVGFNIGLGYSL